MKGKFLCILLILFLVSTAVAEPTDESWIVTATKYGGGFGDEQSSESISVDGGDLLFKQSTDESSKTIWRMHRVFDYPSGDDDFKINFNIKVTAPDIDLDGGKIYSSGADDGDDMDGANFFVYLYGGNLTYDTPGYEQRSWVAYAFPSSRSNLCHVHRECNFFGPTRDLFSDCDSAGNDAYQGWVYDGKVLFSGSPYVNEFNAPALEDGEWKSVSMRIDGSDCTDSNGTNYETLSLVIVGVDFDSTKPFTWELKNVEIEAGSETTSLPFDNFYKFDEDASTYSQLVVPNYCGDEEVAEDEECDGTEGLESGFYCSNSCKLNTECGDNIIVGDEVCDGSSVDQGFQCSSDCSAFNPVCGDDKIIGGELCDGTQVTSGFLCSNTCDAEAPVCGDNILVATEECDGTAGANETHACAIDCTLFEQLSIAEDAMITKMLALMSNAQPGNPAISEIDLQGGGNITAKRILEQIKIKEVAGFSVNEIIYFCGPGATVCEEDYILSIDEFKLTTTSMSVASELRGVMKVYKSEGGAYYIGYKPYSPGLIPDLSQFTNIWLVLVAVIVIGVFVLGSLTLLLGGTLVMRRKKRAKRPGQKPDLLDKIMDRLKKKSKKPGKGVRI